MDITTDHLTSDFRYYNQGQINQLIIPMPNLKMAAINAKDTNSGVYLTYINIVIIIL